MHVMLNKSQAAKTDFAIPYGLAILARNGLLRGWLCAAGVFRELRLIAPADAKTQRGILSGEKNRLHKILSDGGIR